MLRPIIILCLLFFLYHHSYSQQNKPHKFPFRTDGYYYYDNGIDTIALIAGGQQMQMDMLRFMQQKGYIDKVDSGNKYIFEAKNSDGSTYISLISFFNDASGICKGTIFRRKDVMDTLLKEAEVARSGKDMGKEFDLHSRISHITYQTDSTFTFITAANDEFFGTTHFCKIENNRLHICKQYHQAPQVILPELIYEFVLFKVGTGK